MHDAFIFLFYFLTSRIGAVRFIVQFDHRQIG